MSLDNKNPIKNKIICIGGPTASGKTTLAIALANQFNTNILSADSRQFYQEMTIGTAVPTKTELNSAPHFFIQDRSLNEPLTAYNYAQEARALLNKLWSSNPIQIVCGGSGLFIKALTHGLDNYPNSNGVLKARLNAIFNDKGIEGIQNYYQNQGNNIEVDFHNPHRLIRAIELFELKKIGYTKAEPIHADVIHLAINFDRKELYNRINNRVDNMMDLGLLDEVKSLHAFKSSPLLKTVGYAEILDHLDGKKELSETIDLIKQNTRRYAKRQITWFKNQFDTHWVDPKNTLAHALEIISLKK